MKLPKGASAAVDAAVKNLWKNWRGRRLAKISKLHVPHGAARAMVAEPPKTEGRKREARLQCLNPFDKIKGGLGSVG